MFFKIISYLKFLLKSTNQHGVHSPFVYNFVTKGLYQKKGKQDILTEYSELQKRSKKEQKILSKIITYFNIQTLYFDLFTLENDSKKQGKLLYLKNLEDFNIQTDLKKKINYFLIVPGIHQHKTDNLKWEKIIKNKEATVTIDLFYFGLIFFRKKQEKEHFTIRV